MSHTILVNLWQTWQYAQSHSQRTVTERVSTVRRMSVWCNVAPERATMEDIVTWLAEGGDWSAQTRWTYHTSLAAWFLWLQKQGHRMDNPMLLIPKPKRPRNVPRPTTHDELARILGVRMWTATRAKVLLATLQGLRAHEIAKVRGEHFDLVANQMEVKGKGGETKVLPLHPDVAAVAAKMPTKGYWFPGTSGGHVHRGSVCNSLRAVFDRAGVPGSGHKLRHWYGSSLLEAGVDLRTTQELMRHASIQSTQIYTKVNGKMRADGIARLALPGTAQEGTEAA